MGKTAIILEYVYDSKRRKFWKLKKSIDIQLSNGEAITIPEGMMTDLSSVPKFLWSIVRPFGNFILAALVHDYLYIYKPYSRAFADKEMLLISNKINRNKLDNYTRYVFVRAFGWIVWYKLL